MLTGLLIMAVLLFNAQNATVKELKEAATKKIARDFKNSIPLIWEVTLIGYPDHRAEIAE